MLPIQDTVLKLYEHYLTHGGVVTDSRHITPQAIFFALKGLHFDGNTFAKQALDNGAAYAVIDDERYKKDERYLLVEDAVTALQRLAHHHRCQLKIPVIGITGSSGKTTTKELLHAVLSCRYTTKATQGNLNNHIGVPLTILAIDKAVEIAIVEMGANHVGEIARLCDMAMPTHGLITNIRKVHLEGFGSLAGVQKGKGELYDYLRQHQGKVFINSKEPLLCELAVSLEQPMYYPRPQDYYPCELVSADPFVVYKSENGEVVASQLLGEYHFDNIAAALCVAKYFGVNETAANEAIKRYQPSNNRSQLITKGSNTIFLDSYNSNLVSTMGAIQALNALPATHKVLILGGMEELGEESEAAHQALGTLTTQATYKAVLLCGPQMIVAKAANPHALYFPNKEDLVAYLKRQRFEHTALLIKGSRSLQLETVVEHIACE